MALEPYLVDGLLRSRDWVVVVALSCWCCSQEGLHPSVAWLATRLAAQLPLLLRQCVPGHAHRRPLPLQVGLLRLVYSPLFYSNQRCANPNVSHSNPIPDFESEKIWPSKPNPISLFKLESRTESLLNFRIRVCSEYLDLIPNANLNLIECSNITFKLVISFNVETSVLILIIGF